MEYTFSDRVQSLKPSAIREIFKYASDPDMITLSAGNPAPEAFPAEEIAAIAARILHDRPVDALQYGLTEGYPPLRRRLGAYLRDTHGAGRDFDDILITSGAQQVMDLLTKSVCNEGDTVICESPSFIGSLNSFRSYRVRLRGVPMEQDGMDLCALEQALREERNVKFIYTIPNFQNPTGVTMSAEKRRGLYALAARYNVLILEDNPYGDLRFDGEAIPPIKALDEDGRVVYAGTFSKVISPGVRVGYALGPSAILQKMIVCKQGEDVHTNMLGQMICDEFMASCDFNAHLAGLRDIYRRKYALAMRGVADFLSPPVSVRPVQGGLFLWCTLPAGADMPAFCRAAVGRRVCVVPGNAFLTDETAPCLSFRVNFSTPTNAQLTEGIQILGGLARELYHEN